MVKRSKGTLSGKTKRMVRRKKITIPAAVRKFRVGDKVVFRPQATDKGRPHLRHKNRHGVIKEARGRNSYVVEIKDGGKIKNLVSSAIHLRNA